MSVCTFFGHRECPEAVRKELWNTMEKLIRQGVDTFYVGNQGQFDAVVRSSLRQLQYVYPHIQYAVVLAYLPTHIHEHEDYSDTMYPEGLEAVPQRFAIDRRNQWLLDRSDHCVCYIQHPWGGAYKFARAAKRQGKQVVNLCGTGIKL